MKPNKNLNDDVLILIPVLNEAKSIIPLIQDLKNFFNNILVVDDGSSDGTSLLLKETKSLQPRRKLTFEPLQQKSHLKLCKLLLMKLVSLLSPLHYVQGFWQI